MAAADTNFISIPVISILSSLPPELKARVRPTNLGDATLSISVDRVLPQLASGAVRVSFSELRAVAPELFHPSPELDATPVTLPLGEVLSRIDPALLSRRPAQRQVEVPSEIAGPFGAAGKGLAVSVSPKGDTTHTTRIVKPAAPIAAPMPPSAPAPAAAPITQFTRKPALTPPASPTPRIAPATAAPPAPAPAAMRPTMPPQPTTPITPAAPPITPFRQTPAQPVQSMPQKTVAEAHSPVAPIAPVPQTTAPSASPTPPSPISPAEATANLNANPIPVSSALRSLGSSIGLTAPAKNSGPSPNQPSRPAASHTPTPQPAHVGPSVIADLLPLTEGWPEALRLELAHLHAENVKIVIPLNTLEETMRRGKVAFPWKTIRSWLQPALPQHASPNDATVVELSLKALTPLFLAAKREMANQPRQKIAVDEKIPNLFFGFPQTEQETPTSAPAPVVSVPVIPPPAAPASSSDTNYYVWNENSDGARIDETDFKRKPLETNFTSRYATPNEVVAAAMRLDGVVGALVALPDGLKVSSQLPADVNGDTLAGFLPQIFGKVSQCTKELRMGELNNLNFTVGNIPWKIFRVNAIFFAAYGRAGQGLPTAQLAALAAQLDRKKQQ